MMPIVHREPRWIVRESEPDCLPPDDVLDDHVLRLLRVLLPFISFPITHLADRIAWHIPALRDEFLHIVHRDDVVSCCGGHKHNRLLCCIRVLAQWLRQETFFGVEVHVHIYMVRRDASPTHAALPVLTAMRTLLLVTDQVQLWFNSNGCSYGLQEVGAPIHRNDLRPRFVDFLVSKDSAHSLVVLNRLGS